MSESKKAVKGEFDDLIPEYSRIHIPTIHQWFEPIIPFWENPGKWMDSTFLAFLDILSGIRSMYWKNFDWFWFWFLLFAQTGATAGFLCMLELKVSCFGMVEIKINDLVSLRSLCIN